MIKKILFVNNNNNNNHNNNNNIDRYKVKKEHRVCADTPQLGMTFKEQKQIMVAEIDTVNSRSNIIVWPSPQFHSTRLQLYFHNCILSHLRTYILAHLHTFIFAYLYNCILS